MRLYTIWFLLTKTVSMLLVLSPSLYRDKMCQVCISNLHNKVLSLLKTWLPSSRLSDLRSILVCRPTGCAIVY